jgi:asparagine synthase (glutamine-hydrolysing)
MCGITGWIDWQMDLTIQEQTLETMTSTLAPRGPDAQEIWLTTQAAFGHRRLIVVDPEGGRQPMTRHRQGNSYTICYNGELYNTEELRRELLGRGHSFTGWSDTEVLLASYMEWGSKCVDYLNGIYAFAIWDEINEKLFLARDRMGVKPFFYTHQGSSFIFGSELKALLAHPQVKPEVDGEGLAEILLMGPSRTPGHGIFRGISELKPGYCLEYSRQGTRIWQYWALESKPHLDDLDTTTAKVGELFRAAVERQLVADVPVCTFLSGGLDSSAITASAAAYFRQKGHHDFHTYSVDFVDNDKYFQSNRFTPNADAPWIKLMSQYLNTTHHYIQFDTPELIEALQAGVYARDMPGMTDVDTSLYLFCREVKKDATVALSGECADEIFGGYPWFEKVDSPLFNTFPWVRLLKERASLLSPDLVKLIKPEEYVRARYEEALSEVPRLTGENHQEAQVREMFYLNLTRFMTTLLDRKDRMSMAVGLEVRVPFCDHHLVEYVWNIPWEMKRYHQREKGILRRALEGLLPDDILWRKKSPYPKTHHPAYLQAVQRQAMDILGDASSPLHQLFDTTAIKAMAKANGLFFGAPWFGQLMNDAQYYAYLIQLDIWLRDYHISIKM